MAWLFSHRDPVAEARRLDRLMAAHLASTEALSLASAEAKVSAEEDTQRARAIADAASERLNRQDERRRHRQAQIAMLQGAMDRDR